MQTASFLSFADCLPDPLLLVTRAGEILAGNKPAVRLLKPPQDTLNGRRLIDYIQETASQLDDYLQRCSISQQPVAGTLTCLSADERTLCYGRALQPGSTDSDILLRCMPTLSDHDDLQVLGLRLDTLQREIARLQQIEARFISSEAHTRAVLNTAVEGIVTIDKHGIVQSFNLAAERIFGYSAGEIIGHNINRLMPQPHRDGHDRYLHNYLRTGHRKIIGIGREVQGLRKDGSLVPLELSISEIRVGDQHHFTGILRDISERKHNEESLRQHEEEIRQHRERLAHVDRIGTMGEMASGIAHEINQPLTAISSYARACYRLINAGLTDSAELLETLDKISVQAQRAGDVIHGLRDFVRKRKSRRRLCDLNQLVADTLVLAETDAREHNFIIKHMLAEQPLSVIVDPIQIQQVILNLIRNAAEAMIDVACAGETVTVVVTTGADDPKMAQVAIIDKGIGIHEEIAEKLFEPFFTTKSSGTGIGLAISRTIITSHGGRLWYEHNPNEGVTMHFTLPLASDANDD